MFIKRMGRVFIVERGGKVKIVDLVWMVFGNGGSFCGSKLRLLRAKFSKIRFRILPAY